MEVFDLPVGALSHTCAYTTLYTGLSVWERPSRVGSKFIMVRRADGAVAWGLRRDCGGPLINHADVIGRWEPHGCCGAERWPHALSPLWLTLDRDGVKGAETWSLGEVRRSDGGWNENESGLRRKDVQTEGWKNVGRTSVDWKLRVSLIDKPLHMSSPR